MRNIISAFIIIALLISCNSGDKKDQTNVQSSDSDTTLINNASEKENDQLKEIDIDEALIATALLAAPVGSRSDCTVIG